ncbi:AAA domain-containing protein [Nocardia sp. CDC153]|uniref:AAA domain-containing protein n=1 Tax=Nocardia sp. CDC153 TaxID=3112167 RepID=UPI002DBE55F5|nr:AAA domain-containing protein [Nocardia sp. CDC153]MEC3952577.1 AAA domain-containing protein [Nocardia sp. CDC153]
MSDAKLPYPVAELLEAVRLEILAERRSDAKDTPKVSLSKGRLITSATDSHEYLFACKKWDESLDGSPVLARPSNSKQGWFPAEASRLPDGNIRLVTSESFGQRAENVQLRKDDSAGLLVLVERLESVGDDDALRVESGGWVVAQGSPTVEYDDRPGRWIADWPGLQLNPRQRLAVQQSLASEILFLWGPPGTGKTDVVGHIVEGNVRQGHNVLFLAPTRVAVDQALERICGLLAHDEGFMDGMVQRAGDIELPSLRARYGSAIDAEQIIARMAEKLDAEIIQATDAVNHVQVWIDMHGRAQELEVQLAGRVEAKSAAATSIADARRGLEKANADIAQLQRQLDRADNSLTFFADRKAARNATLRLQLADAEGRKQAFGRQRRSGELDLFNASTEMALVSGELDSVKATLRSVPPCSELSRQLEALRKGLSELEQQRSKIKQTVRSRCRVLGTTVAKAVQTRKLMDRVDVVVIDEAGMVDLPSAWLVAALAQKRVVIAGDFRQLPAITKADSDRKATADERAHADRWGCSDPFRAAGLVDERGGVIRDHRLVPLDTQYRMRSPICELVNAVAYPDAPLQTGRGDISGIPPNPLVDAAVMLIDTTRQRIPGPDNKANTVNEAVVHELIRGLQYEGVLPGRKWQESEIAANSRPTDRLAVIAPYRAQVRALQGSLKYRFGNQYEGLVDTIHRFQGSQRPIVIFDTAVGAGKSPGLFYSESGLDSKTCRLLNVALSRAQDHLVVVADLEHLREHLPGFSEARIMLDHLEKHAQVMSADQLIPIREAAQLSTLSEEELRRPAFFPADEVPKAVEWDVGRSATSIELHSPFLDSGPVSKWSRLFGERVSAGVRVVVYTRADKEQRDDAAAERHRKRVEQLRLTGCEVKFRERMHEKVLIIDAAILWHGSLNLLANTGPTDLMMRFTDPESCARVSRVIEQARKDRAARPTSWQPNAQKSANDQHRPNGIPAQSNTGNTITPGTVINGRMYLNVPFADKDTAKRELGAQWDPKNKLWHVDAATVPPERAKRWLR